MLLSIFGNEFAGRLVFPTHALIVNFAFEYAAAGESEESPEDYEYYSRNKKIPIVLSRGERDREVSNLNDQIYDQVEEHVPSDGPAYFATGLVYFEIHKYQVVLVDHVLHIEKESGNQRDQRHEAREQQAVEEYHKRVALMVAEIELVVILELRFYD